ncbi:MAG: CoA pyrophosphatase [Negativicutes bacterium]|nr:CoA pyrophosphatase [Negativicutes bacterium]
MMKVEQFCGQLQEALAGRVPKIQNETDYFSSAVVVPLIRQGDELGVLFEVRSAKLAWQPGQICFPGGRIEPYDANPEAAAQRETCEELGLTTDDFQLFGQLDYMVSPIGVIVYPYAGYIYDLTQVCPSKDEVAEVFVVPLEYLLATEPQTADMEVATRPLPGFPHQLVPDDYPRDWLRRATYPVLFYQYGDHVIWGLTARLLYNFICICRNMGKK